MIKKSRLIPIRLWAVDAAPDEISHFHRRALQLALEGRIAGAVHYGGLWHKTPPKGSRGGFKGIWMVPANAKWPGRKPYQFHFFDDKLKSGRKRKVVKKIKNLQSDVENA